MRALLPLKKTTSSTNLLIVGFVHRRNHTPNNRCVKRTRYSGSE
jgi:hypothetical protein